MVAISTTAPCWRICLAIAGYSGRTLRTSAPSFISDTGTGRVGGGGFGTLKPLLLMIVVIGRPLLQFVTQRGPTCGTSEVASLRSSTRAIVVGMDRGCSIVYEVSDAAPRVKSVGSVRTTGRCTLANRMLGGGGSTCSRSM